MTRNSMRGFAAGIFLTCAIVGFFYYSFMDTKSEDVTKGSLTETDVEAYLESHNQTAVSKETYREFLAYKDSHKSKESNQSTKNENSTEKKDSSNDAKKAKDKVTTAKVIIKSGMSTQAIVDQMVKKGLLNDGDAFVNYLKDTGRAREVQIGTYKVSSDMSKAEMADVLTR